MPFDADGWWTDAINYTDKRFRSPNFYPGNKGRLAVVLHITDGTDSRGWLSKPLSKVSSHFLNRDEGVYQLVSIFDSAWANGIWNPGHAWTGVADSENPNKYTISIENEGRPKKALTPKQQQQLTTLLQAIAARYPQFAPYRPGVNLLRHTDISPSHRPNCPGPLFDFAAIAAAANVAPARRYRIKPAVPGGYVQVYQGRGTGYKEASIAGVSARLRTGDIVEVDDITNSWAHLASGLGFIEAWALESPVGNVGLTFVSPPRISKATFVKVLRDANSPAADEAESMYDGITSVGVDPAVGLAFFKHESTYGKYGICKTHDTKNIGNVRRAYNAARGRQLDIPGRGPFWKFDSWTQGAIDWAERMRYRYAEQQGLDTVDKAIPVYAPSSDNNVPERYIKDVTDTVNAWQAQEATK